MNQPVKPFARLSAEQWQQLIHQQRESGLSQKNFCQSHNLSLGTFAYWKNKLNKEQASSSAGHPELPSDPDWISFPAGISTEPGWQMELELPGGVVLRMRR